MKIPIYKVCIRQSTFNFYICIFYDSIIFNYNSVFKDGIIQGILTEEKDELVSDYEITLTKDLKEICIYKGNYMISAPAKTLDESISIYKSIVDIPIN